MSWGTVLTAGLVAVSLPAGFLWSGRHDDHTSRVGQIPDSVTPWHTQQGFSILEGEGPVTLYDWEQGNIP